MLFNYEAMDAQGQKISDSIDAKTQDDAESKIRSMGYFITKIKSTEEEDNSKPAFYKNWVFKLFDYKINLIIERN